MCPFFLRSNSLLPSSSPFLFLFISKPPSELPNTALSFTSATTLPIHWTGAPSTETSGHQSGIHEPTHLLWFSRLGLPLLLLSTSAASQSLDISPLHSLVEAYLRHFFNTYHYDKYICSLQNSALGKLILFQQSKATLWEEFWFHVRWNKYTWPCLSHQMLPTMQAAGIWGTSKVNSSWWVEEGQHLKHHWTCGEFTFFFFFSPPGFPGLV